MSKNDRGGIPGFADPAYDLLDSHVTSLVGTSGVRWAKVAKAFLELPLDVAERVVEEANELPEVITARANAARARMRQTGAQEPAHPIGGFLHWDIPG